MYLLSLLRIPLLLLVVILPLSAQAQVTLHQISFKQLPGWWDNSEQLKHTALGAWVKSCEKLLRAQDEVNFGSFSGVRVNWKPLCHKAKGVYKRVKESSSFAEKDDMARYFFEKNFVPHQIHDGKKTTGLFTGYYEPELAASRTKTATYRYPIYKKPKNLKPKTPYLTRRAIDEGALDGKGLELFFVADPVRLFFLHVQGSGRLRFEDGSGTYVGFAAKNEQPYTAIGKVLIEKGVLKAEDVTAPAIMEWLYANPKEAVKVMQRNDSYVFFQELKDSHVKGAQNVALTPYASLAVDREYIPLGTLLWLSTVLPDKEEKEKVFNALMVAQDTGSAIKGPIRGDVFCGPGKDAEWLAGHMKQTGSLYMLLPKEVVHP